MPTFSKFHLKFFFESVHFVHFVRFKRQSGQKISGQSGQSASGHFLEKRKGEIWKTLTKSFKMGFLEVLGVVLLRFEPF